MEIATLLPVSAIFCFLSEPNILKHFLNFIMGSAQTNRERERERERERKRERERDLE